MQPSRRTIAWTGEDSDRCSRSWHKGETASWHPYDWEVDDGSLAATPVICEPAPVIILDGAYSARPELADLFDLRVLLDAPADLRRAQLIQREGEDYREEWNARWDEAEQWYFGNVMPPESFDLVIQALWPTNLRFSVTDT